MFKISSKEYDNKSCYYIKLGQDEAVEKPDLTNYKSNYE